jgi:hypothetical protein
MQRFLKNSSEWSCIGYAFVLAPSTQLRSGQARARDQRPSPRARYQHRRASATAHRMSMKTMICSQFPW